MGFLSFACLVDADEESHKPDQELEYSRQVLEQGLELTRSTSWVELSRQHLIEMKREFVVFGLLQS